MKYPPFTFYSQEIKLRYVKETFFGNMFRAVGINLNAIVDHFGFKI